MRQAITEYKAKLREATFPQLASKKKPYDTEEEQKLRHGKADLRIKRPQVRILLGAPQTVDVLRAVSGFSFCPIFLSIVGFLKSCPRAWASMMEVWVREFLLCRYSIILGSFWFFDRFATNSATNHVEYVLLYALTCSSFPHVTAADGVFKVHTLLFSYIELFIHHLIPYNENPKGQMPLPEPSRQRQKISYWW